MDDAQAEAFGDWLERIGRSEHTIEAYLRYTASDDQQDRIRSRSLSPSTRRVILNAWRSYARFTKDQDLIDELAELKLPPPGRVKEQLPLPPEVYERVREVIDEAELRPPIRAVLGIMANRGLRRGDVLRLRRREVSSALKTGVLVYEAKGAKRLEFGVLKTYRRYLRLLEQSFEVPRFRRGKRVELEQVVDLVAASERAADMAIHRSLREVAELVVASVPKKTGIRVEDIRPHVLRRSYAVAFYEKTRDIMALTQHMGWSSIATAQRYIDHSRRAELDEIAEDLFG